MLTEALKNHLTQDILPFWLNLIDHEKGGRPGQTGTLASDERCDCGYVLRAGSYERDYER